VITADQLVAHAIGDYVLQSDWMATEKTKKSVAALCHVLTYALPFLFLRPSLPALAVIVSTHFVIDRWRLARFVVWLKNFIGPVSMPRRGVLHFYNLPWSECRATGYPPQTPAWLAVWLLIIADNIMHVCINGLALKYL
jgi:hypothetical protein